ncbi:hypothetical protein [Acerihabitans sp.]|uniref:hypothetical protein n=1 Tax=Acerihabitans sp. TaxID=2811394 RepID=UPI002ED9513C
MHITGNNPSVYTKITSWTSSQLKIRTNILTTLIKKLANIRNNSARASAKTMECEENHGAEVETSDGAAMPSFRDSGGPLPDRGFMSFMRALAGFNGKRYDLVFAQKNNTDMTEGSTLKKYSSLEVLHDQPVELEVYISQIAKAVVKDMASGLLNRKQDKLAWQMQEFEVYLPARINRTIDQVMTARGMENKPIDHTATFKRDIIQQAMAETGIWHKYAHIARVENASATSTVALVRQHMDNRQMNCLELIQPIADRVYETLFNCPGYVEQVTQAARQAIAQKLENESHA